MLVMLLESDPKTLKHSLEDMGFRVKLVDSVAGADREARSARPEIIVLELELLGSDGLVLVRRWRTAGVKAHVLVLSAKGTLQDKLDAFSHGADDLVVTPYAIEELTARLAAVNPPSQPAGAEVVTVGALEINSATRTAKRNGKRLDLTPREFDLLEYLAANRGKPVTRSMIWDHLYENNSGSRSNVIDVYIRYLRMKIDNGFEPPLIITCRGRGYMLRGSAEDAA